MGARRSAVVVGFAQALSVILALGTANAAPLTLTQLPETESQDPSNGIGFIMQRVWRQYIVEADERAYDFAYGIFEANGSKYLVSSFRSADCRPDECDWRVDRLNASYTVEAAGAPFTACGEINKLDVTDDRLTICGNPVQLP